MAQATSFKHDKVVVLLGNDADPIVYTAPCGFTEKSLSFEKEQATTAIPDCTDVGAADWEEHDPIARRVTISGNGVLAEESLATWIAAWESDEPVPAKAQLIGATNTITLTGLWLVNTLTIEGNKAAGRARISVEMASHGAVPSASAAT